MKVDHSDPFAKALYPPTFEMAQCCPNVWDGTETCMMAPGRFGYTVKDYEELIMLRAADKCRRGFVKFEAVRLKVPVRCSCHYSPLSTPTPTPDHVSS